MTDDPHNLTRFIDAQETQYEQALEEITARPQTLALDVVHLPVIGRLMVPWVTQPRAPAQPLAATRSTPASCRICPDTAPDQNHPASPVRN